MLPPLPGSSGPWLGRAAAAARRGKAPLPSVLESGNLSPLLAPPTGAPAVSLPMGFTKVSSPSSPSSSPSLLLPAGLQLVGRPFGDAELVFVAAAVERALSERDREEEDERRGGGPRVLPPLLRECG